MKLDSLFKEHQTPGTCETHSASTTNATGQASARRTKQPHTQGKKDGSAKTEINKGTSFL
jgi:hypothetical protein